MNTETPSSGAPTGEPRYQALLVFFFSFYLHWVASARRRGLGARGAADLVAHGCHGVRVSFANLTGRLWLPGAVSGLLSPR